MGTENDGGGGSFENQEQPVSSPCSKYSHLKISTGHTCEKTTLKLSNSKGCQLTVSKHRLTRKPKSCTIVPHKFLININAGTHHLPIESKAFQYPERSSWNG